MTEKRFTNIEHDYENAWIKCNDDGYFMIYAIYKELDESLPSLEDLLNGLSEENEQLNENNLHLHHELRLKNDKVLELEKENGELKDKSYFKKEIERLRLQNKDLLKSNAKLREENKELKEKLEKKQRRIDAYEDYIKTLKEDGVLE